MSAIDVSMRETLLTLWNTFSFFTTYASLNEFDPADAAIPSPGERGPLDRWILSRLASTVSVVTEALAGYEPFDLAATAVGSLVGDLSNWYVRLSRRRFWRTDPDAPAGDTLAAQATLHDVLSTLSHLLAPFCPFVADVMWRGLSGAGDDQSVHLEDWPQRRDALIDRDLEAQMALARRLTSLGRAARSEAGVKVRQPLSRALVFLQSGAPEILHDLVAAELNVDEIDVAEELGDVLEFELVPNFRTLGPRLGEQVKDLKPALARLDGVEAAATLEAGQPIVVELPGGAVELSPDDVQLRVRGQQGFAISREGGEVVALDLTCWTTSCVSAWAGPRGGPTSFRTCARPAGSMSPIASTSTLWAWTKLQGSSTTSVVRSWRRTSTRNPARARGRCWSSIPILASSRPGPGSRRRTAARRRRWGGAAVGSATGEGAVQQVVRSSLVSASSRAARSAASSGAMR